jgi:DNA-binding NarL/FixJ family response regulator
VTRVYLLAAVRLYREGLALALAATGRIDVVGDGADWAAAADEVAALAPEIVLLDMATRQNRRAVPEILALVPAPRLVAIARTDDAHELLEYAEAGVSGYVASSDSVETAVRAIESVARGELLTTPRVAAILLERVRVLAATAPHAPTARLTPREREIADLLGCGHTNKAIAQHLGIEPATVKNHVHNILEKLQVRRRTDAALVLHVGPD